MPLLPPGNTLFRGYFDGNGKLQSTYIGPPPIVCASCHRETYLTASARCAWCRKPLTGASVQLGETTPSEIRRVTYSPDDWPVGAS